MSALGQKRTSALQEVSSLCPESEHSLAPKPQHERFLNRWCQFGLAALEEAALQRKVTRLKEKSGFPSSLPRVKRLFRARFPPRGRQMSCRHRFVRTVTVNCVAGWKQEKEKPDGCCY